MGFNKDVATEEDVIQVLKDSHNKGLKHLIQYIIISFVLYCVISYTDSIYLKSYGIGINMFFAIKSILLSLKILSSTKTIEHMVINKITKQFRYTTLTGIVFSCINIIFLVLSFMRI